DGVWIDGSLLRLRGQGGRDQEAGGGNRRADHERPSRGIVRLVVVGLIAGRESHAAKRVQQTGQGGRTRGLRRAGTAGSAFVCARPQTLPAVPARRRPPRRSLSISTPA